MGEIYLAQTTEEHDQRLAVIKRLLPQLANEPTFIANFIEEGRIAALLNHPNIVRTYELGQAASSFFIAMEYVPAPTLVGVLTEAQRQGRMLSIPLVLHVATQLARAVDYLHRRTDLNGNPLEIIHMDLAPHNVLLQDDATAKLIDFGIARARGICGERRRNLRGRTSYLAPEVLHGLRADQRVDIFALGVMMHEMISGRPLFRSRNERITATRIVHARIPDPCAVRPSCPKPLAEVIRRALLRDRERRYASAHALLADLDRCAVHCQIAQPSTVFEEELRSILNADDQDMRSAEYLAAEAEFGGRTL